MEETIAAQQPEIERLTQRVADLEQALRIYDNALTHLIKTRCIDDKQCNPDEETRKRKNVFLDAERKALGGK